MLAECSGQAATRDQPDLGAHVLDGRHHRQHQERRPKGGVPVLGAGLRIRPDAGRIVIGRPGHEARTQNFEEPRDRVLLGQ